MDFKNYSKHAESTKIYPDSLGLIYLALGLASEAGEVAQVMKKAIRDDNYSPGQKLPDDKVGKLVDELGDCLWYIARLSDELGVGLDIVAKNNIIKLKNRKINNELKDKNREVK